MAEFDAEGYRAMHRRRGEGYRWWKALPCGCYDPRTNSYDRGCGEHDKNGRVYIEQEVDPAWKALVHATRQQIIDPDFGLVAVGSTAISVMPDETPFARLDRVVLTARTVTMRDAVTRAAGTQNDSLPHDLVVAIVTVGQGDVVYRADIDYEQQGERVHWLGGSQPATGSTYSVEYTRHPTYLFLGVESQVPRPDKRGVMMPLRGVLTRQG